MAKRKFAELRWINNDHTITEETDHEFLFYLQNGLLMALRDKGILNEMQYRGSYEKLRNQRCERAGKLSPTEADD